MPSRLFPARTKKTVKAVHRWLSLSVAVLWVFQAITGILIVFHWEIDDATIPASHTATDLGALEHRIRALTPPISGARMVSLWTSAGAPDRYDITIEDAAKRETTVRVKGDGTPIRIDTPDAPRRLIDWIVTLHQSLGSGQIGRWIMGASGLLLLTNIAGGILIAWPRRGTWRSVLSPGWPRRAVVRHYAWHRAVGLVGAIPALLLVSAGTLLAFDDAVAALIHAEPVAMPPIPGQDRVGFAHAVAAAEKALPESRLAAVDPPAPDDATYRVRLRAPGEWRRAYGASFVLVDATNAKVRGIFPAATAPLPRKAYDALFPIHTGEAGGLAGRMLVLCTGLWLASMITLGVRLWWLRRTPGRKGGRS